MKFICLLSAIVVAFLASVAATATMTPLPTGMTGVPLATIINDRDSSVSHFQLMLNDQDMVRGIYLETSTSGSGGPSKTSAQVYWLKEIESRKGVVLGQGKGVKAIFLQGTIEPHGDHGALVIRYLTNGIFRHFAECRINLQRLGPYNWQLVNAYNGRPIKVIRVETWALGISTIANVCPGTKS